MKGQQIENSSKCNVYRAIEAKILVNSARIRNEPNIWGSYRAAAKAIDGLQI